MPVELHRQLLRCSGCCLQCFPQVGQTAASQAKSGRWSWIIYGIIYGWGNGTHKIGCWCKAIKLQKVGQNLKGLLNQGVSPSSFVVCLSSPNSPLKLVSVCQSANSLEQLLRKTSSSEKNGFDAQLGVFQSSCRLADIKWLTLLKVKKIKDFGWEVSFSVPRDKVFTTSLEHWFQCIIVFTGTFYSFSFHLTWLPINTSEHRHIFGIPAWTFD